MNCMFQISVIVYNTCTVPAYHYISNSPTSNFSDKIYITSSQYYASPNPTNLNSPHPQLSSSFPLIFIYHYLNVLFSQSHTFRHPNFGLPGRVITKYFTAWGFITLLVKLGSHATNTLVQYRGCSVFPSA